MTQPAHDTVPTQYAEASGIGFAYRRFGSPQRTPVVFFQHFMGNLDDHDPAISDGLATDREVILFNNTGVASTRGHGAHFQYPDLFLKHARLFLDEQ